ncbi:pyridoxamine 5'-phosphate oxidase family protein [Microbispora rosea]|uniref:pyridoxamine 5'-phosphate oxidase family protein n=1 Tax=Microbispora rosea TaxID=58117 RepID=UPI0037B5C854
MLDPDVRRVLDGASIAHLATVLPDGSPHTAPVYVGTQGDRIVLFTGPGTRKARNLRRDPRMALSVAPADNPFEPVVVRGRAVEWLEGTRRGRSSTGWPRSTPVRPTLGGRSASWS